MPGTFTTGIAVLGVGAVAGGLLAGRPLGVALLDRPSPSAVIAPLPAGIDPASLREAAAAMPFTVVAASLSPVAP